MRSISIAVQTRKRRLKHGCRGAKNKPISNMSWCDYRLTNMLVACALLHLPSLATANCGTACAARDGHSPLPNGTFLPCGPGNDLCPANKTRYCGARTNPHTGVSDGNGFATIAPWGHARGFHIRSLTCGLNDPNGWLAHGASGCGGEDKE